MSIKLKGSSDGSVSFDAPADTSPSGSDITLTLPTSAGSANQFLKNSGIAGELEYSSMVETSTGIGIGGVASPFDKLQVRTVADANFVFSSAGGTEASFEIFNNAGSANTPLNYRASEHKFKIQANEKMRLDSSGRLLVGTDSSTGSHILEVNGGTDNEPIKVVSSDAGSYIRFADDDTTGSTRLGAVDNDFKIDVNSAERLRIDSNGTVFLGPSGSTHNTIANASQTAKLELSGGGGGCGVIELYGGSHSGNSKEIHMHTNSEHRVKIAQTGQFTIHPDSYGFGVRSQNASNSVIEAFFVAHSSTNHDSGTIVYANYLNGNVVNANNSYGQLSDERLKENIIDAPSQWDDIKSLRVRKYNFREDTGYETHTQIGLVAQEAETVCPGLVQENPVNEGETVLDGEGNELESTKRVVSSVLYMKAVKALQEAQTRIETLETQHADLLARVAALEAA